MILYEVQFSKEVDEEMVDTIINENPQLDGKELVEYDSFYIGAPSLKVANIRAEEFLAFSLDGGEYEIIKVEARNDILIANWGEPDDQEDCNCPFCSVKRVAPEDIMSFTCTCGTKITVADTAWESISCPSDECDNEINRRDVKEVGGKWIYTKMM